MFTINSKRPQPLYKIRAAKGGGPREGHLTSRSTTGSWPLVSSHSAPRFPSRAVCQSPQDFCQAVPPQSEYLTPSAKPLCPVHGTASYLYVPAPASPLGTCASLHRWRLLIIYLFVGPAELRAKCRQLWALRSSASPGQGRAPWLLREHLWKGPPGQQMQSGHQVPSQGKSPRGHSRQPTPGRWAPSQRCHIVRSHLFHTN